MATFKIYCFRGSLLWKINNGRSRKPSRVRNKSTI